LAAEIDQPTEGVSIAAPARGLLWWISLGVIIADQITKAIVNARLTPYDSVTVIPGLVDLVHVHNAGVAFGLMNDLEHPFKRVATTALALIALAGITYYARHIKPEERLARIGLSLILGGALGNLIDRVRQSYVIDFVDVYWKGWHFWAFNVADAAITIGAILVFVELLVVHRHASHFV
jgi:signal peptidase II